MFINKIITSTTLPRLRQAVADAGRHMAARDDTEQYSPAWITANRAYDDAVWGAKEAIAAELLPALIGGTWRIPTGRAWPRNPQLRNSVRALLDHPQTFRLTGCTGVPCWGNTVLSAQPYLHPRGDLNCEGVQLAQQFAEHQAGVWHNPELSSWYPSKTTLVVIARGIDAAASASLGFVKLA